MTVRFADTAADFSNIGSRVPSPDLDINNIEEKIRNHVVSRNARVDEYVKDFDQLRTGYITKAQFDRCLDQHYGIILNHREEATLMHKYGSDINHPGMVNYREFCKTIDKTFNPSMFDSDPSTQCVPAVLAPRPLSQESLQRCEVLLKKIAPYYKYHGINIKTNYTDFDQHNIGLVTESQFYRRFAGPKTVTQFEQSLLARKYMHETKSGLINYLKFYNDMEILLKDLEPNTTGDDGITRETEKQKNKETMMAVKTSRQGRSLQDVFDKIRVAVHKNGIRTTEFFKDHDKLRSGVITRNQFVCGLSLCCGTQANLSRHEINLIVDFYATEDGRVRYKGFCRLMENAFNVPDLEKKPTVDVYRPPTGALAKMPNTLAGKDEEKIQHVLYQLRETVRKKRLLLYPYFKDFDRGSAYTRGISSTQFSRMLHMVGLNLPQTDLQLIIQKFEYPISRDINYPAFIQAIDPEYCGRADVKGEWNTTTFADTTKKTENAPNISSVDVDELIRRIRNHVLVKRIRVEEFFYDFDPLRHGSISLSRFRMGLSAMGQQHLTEAQILAIINRYLDPKREQNVLWTAFLRDIEIVFTLRNLEKTPTARIPPPEAYLIAKPGTCDWSKQPEEKKELFEYAMHKMRQKTSQRRILTKPCFQDFDRHNNGYVTKSQFRQCLAYLCFDCDPTEVDVVYEKFSDNTGFNYLSFLEELQPSERQDNKYLQRMETLKMVNQKVAVPHNCRHDIHTVMNKIKTKVVKEGVRVYEFMKDYDKLRTGRMLNTTFPRALDLCNLGLTASEILTLRDAYASTEHPDYIDYYRFCDDVESAFTLKGLEKNPAIVPTQFKINSEASNIKLSPEAEDLLQTVMHRLADRVRIRRIQLFPLFKDYDRVHNGTVSRSQLHRVLSELELGSLVSAREFHVLYEKFDSVIGGKHDFDYIRFCDTLNNYAQFEPYFP